MDWESVASDAVARHVTARDAAEAGRRGRVRRLRLQLRAKFARRNLEGGMTAGRHPRARAPGYYVGSSDWPISRSDRDASPEQVMAALQGLSLYYGAAMRTLGQIPEDNGRAK
jgi:hypothetical protein